MKPKASAERLKVQFHYDFFEVVYLKLIVTAISFLSTGFGEHVLHPQDTEKYTTV